MGFEAGCWDIRSHRTESIGRLPRPSAKRESIPTVSSARGLSGKFPPQSCDRRSHNDRDHLYGVLSVPRPRDEQLQRTPCGHREYDALQDQRSPRPPSPLACLAIHSESRNPSEYWCWCHHKVTYSRFKKEMRNYGSRPPSSNQSNRSSLRPPRADGSPLVRGGGLHAATSTKKLACGRTVHAAPSAPSAPIFPLSTQSTCRLFESRSDRSVRLR